MSLIKKILLGTVISLVFILFIINLQTSPINTCLNELKARRYRTVKDDWGEELINILDTRSEEYYKFYKAMEWGDFVEMVDDGFRFWVKNDVGYNFHVFYDKYYGMIWFDIPRSMTVGTSSEGHFIIVYFNCGIETEPEIPEGLSYQKYQK